MTKYVQQCVDTLIAAKARSVTKFVAPNQIVRASMTLYDKRWPRKNWNSLYVKLTLGKPNYREREFIKDLVAAGEKFPVRKLWVRPLSTRA